MKLNKSTCAKTGAVKGGGGSGTDMRKEKPSVTPEDVEDAISNWEEALRWIAKGWNCHEEYDHDVYSRELQDIISP